MRKPSLRAYRIVSLFLLGCLLFNYPILALFNLPGAVLGIPVLYAYIFTAWALLGEAPRWYHAVGAALILPAIWLATRKSAAH